MELRSPAQLTFEAFRAFNRPYSEQLEKWKLVLGPYSAVCRTNVVPAKEPPAEPAVHAFSYSVPSDYSRDHLLRVGHRRHRRARADHCRGGRVALPE